MMSSNIQLSFPYEENGYAHKCFPVRNIRRYQPDDGGAWLVEYKAEKERQLKNLQHTSNVPKKKIPQVQKKAKEFTTAYLTKAFHLDNPLAVFSLNLNGKHLTSVKQDFSPFGNVLYIEAGDNQLKFETFKTFPRLEELHLQVNGITDISLTHMQFPCLKRIDLSYNQLTEEALLNLGKLKNLKELTLRGCGLKSLHLELSRAYLPSESDRGKGEKKKRFAELEHLDLSENNLTELSTFASLAGLRKLKTLNLSSNKVCGVPHLRLIVSHRHFSASTVKCETPLGTVESSIVSNQLSEEASVGHVTKAKEFFEVKNSADHMAPDNKTVNVTNNNNNNNTKQVVHEENKETCDKESLKETSEVIKEDIFNNTQANTQPDVTSSTEPSIADNLDADEKDTIAKEDEEEEEEYISDGEGNVVETFGIEDDVDADGLPAFENDLKVDLDLEEVSNVNASVEFAEHSGKTAEIPVSGDCDVNMSEINEKLKRTVSIQDDSTLVDSDPVSVQVGSEVSQQIADESEEMDPIGEEFDLFKDDLPKQINFTLGYPSENELPSSGDDVVNSQLRIPFPSLKMLDVSNNSISEQEGLLALTSWPVLQDLKLWGNPLMQLYRGSPPVVTHHLHMMCGVNVHRKPPEVPQINKSIGPSIAKSAKTYRVKNDLPPIKRNTMLMIEAEIRKAVEEKNRIEDDGVHSVDVEDEVERETEEVETNAKDTDEAEIEGIFLTQVNEDDDTAEDVEIPPAQLETKTEPLVGNKYEGYEELLKIDETYGPESEILVPSTVQASVQALRHMLKNPLVFKEGNYNRKCRLDPVEQKKKASAGLRKVIKKSDIIDDALETICKKETTYRENLATVIQESGTNPVMKEKFPDAKKILKRVQKKYDKVRLESLRPISAKQAELSRMSTRGDKHDKDLILMRMKQGRIGDLYSPRSTAIPQSRASTQRNRTAP